jgi:putative transposase
MLAINGMPDHIHFLIGLRPNCCLSDLIREIKKASNDYIREQGFTKLKFNWQEGYGAFSYGYWDIQTVINYINNQKIHHQKKSFKEEYLEFMNEFKIPYEEKYLFDWY